MSNNTAEYTDKVGDGAGVWTQINNGLNSHPMYSILGLMMMEYIKAKW